MIEELYNKDELIMQSVLEKRNNLKKKYKKLKDDLYIELYSYRKGRILKYEEMNKAKLSRVSFIETRLNKLKKDLDKFNWLYAKLKNPTNQIIGDDI